MPTTGVSIDGLIRVQHTMAELLSRAGDMTPAMDVIGRMGEEQTAHRFESQRAPDGQTWTPSARAKAQGGRTLVDHGRLLDSLTHRASPNSAEWGTNLIYGPTHQFGATITGKSGGRLGFTIPGIGFRSPLEVIIPARPFLGIDDEDAQSIHDQLHDFFADAFS